MKVRGGKGSGATTALVVVLVLAVVGLAGYILVSRNAAQPEETQKRNVLVTEENVGESVAEMKTAASLGAGSYTAEMNSTWHFPDGKSPSDDAYVANSNDNELPVWFGVTLGDGRTVYESPVLPVGTSISQFALDEELEEGDYGATVTYHLIDEDQNELSTLSIGITIIVGG